MVRLEVTGIKELNKNLDKKARQVNNAAYQGLNSVAIDILAEAKNNLKANSSIGTGKTRDSGRVKKEKDESIDVIFDGAAFWIEFGRIAKGKLPPVSPIIEWIKKKGIQDTYNVKTGKRAGRGSAVSYSKISSRKTVNKSDYYKRVEKMAWAIAVWLKTNNTPKKPFLYPALRNNEARVISELDKAIKKVL